MLIDSAGCYRVMDANATEISSEDSVQRGNHYAIGCHLGVVA